MCTTGHWAATWWAEQTCVHPPPWQLHQHWPHHHRRCSQHCSHHHPHPHADPASRAATRLAMLHHPLHPHLRLLHQIPGRGRGQRQRPCPHRLRCCRCHCPHRHRLHGQTHDEHGRASETPMSGGPLPVPQPPGPLAGLRASRFSWTWPEVLQKGPCWWSFLTCLRSGIWFGVGQLTVLGCTIRVVLEQVCFIYKTAPCGVFSSHV